MLGSICDTPNTEAHKFCRMDWFKIVVEVTGRIMWTTIIIL